MAIQLDNNELPPELIKGNGIPVTGKTPIFIPILMAAWVKNMTANPIIISILNGSSAFEDNRTNRHRRNPKRIITVPAPTKPNSSPIVAKIKSV